MTDSGMDDLISRAAAIKGLLSMCPKKTEPGSFDEYGVTVLCGAVDVVIKGLPAVDAVPVVRCKDCKHWWKANELCTHKRHVHGTVCVHECKATDYCSDGERRDSE